jgi:hypothetical protein
MTSVDGVSGTGTLRVALRASLDPDPSLAPARTYPGTRYNRPALPGLGDLTAPAPSGMHPSRHLEAAIRTWSGGEDPVEEGDALVNAGQTVPDRRGLALRTVHRILDRVRRLATRRHRPRRDRCTAP